MVILEDKGYDRKRCRYNKKAKEWYYTDDDLSVDFSTMVSGGIDVRYIKGDREIIYGLAEHKKPPTLISPRPRISVKRNRDLFNFDENGNKIKVGSDVWVYNEDYTDSMTLCMQMENHEDILKAMYDDSIIFKYDLTK